MRKLQKIIRVIKGISIGRFSDTLFCEPELYKAVSSKDLGKIKSLLKKGADSNECSSNGNTPLHKAIMLENISAIKLLLVYNANLFINNKQNKTPYDLSQEKALVKDLFENDKEINLRVKVQTLHNNLEQCYKQEE